MLTLWLGQYSWICLCPDVIASYILMHLRHTMACVMFMFCEVIYVQQKIIKNQLIASSQFPDIRGCFSLSQWTFILFLIFCNYKQFCNKYPITFFSHCWKCMSQIEIAESKNTYIVLLDVAKVSFRRVVFPFGLHSQQ